MKANLLTSFQVTDFLKVCFHGIVWFLGPILVHAGLERLVDCLLEFFFFAMRETLPKDISN